MVPSQDVATRIGARFAGSKPEIEPLESEVAVKQPRETRVDRLKVAVIGGIYGVSDPAATMRDLVDALA